MHVGAVERAQIFENVTVLDQLDVAVLLGNHTVEDLMRVPGMPSKRIVTEELTLLPPAWPHDADASHNPSTRLPGAFSGCKVGTKGGDP